MPEEQLEDGAEDADQDATGEDNEGEKEAADEDGKDEGPKTVDQDQLHIRLRNSSKFTRVHVVATQYLPAFPAFTSLSSVRDPEPYATRITNENLRILYMADKENSHKVF